MLEKLKKKSFGVFLLAALVVFVNLNTTAIFAANGDQNIIVGNSEYPATAEGLNKAIVDIAEGGTIVLDADIEAENPIYIFGSEAYVRQASFQAQKIGNKNFTIDGKGHTVKANYDVINITGSTNPSYATAGQDDWGMQSVFAIAQYGGTVTIKDLTADANQRTTLGFWVWRSGDQGASQSQNGFVIQDHVTNKNAITKFGKGGYGTQVNASHVKAINPISIDNHFYGFNVDLGKNLDDFYSKLEIEGVSIYNEENQDLLFQDAEGYGKRGNIICEKKPNISVVDNGQEYVVNNYNETGTYMGELSPAIKTPDSLPNAGEEYKVYLPQTLDSDQYDIHQATRGFWFQEDFIIFGNRPVKIKAEDFKVKTTVKYNWDLEKTGSIDENNVPHYTVKAIAKDKEIVQVNGKDHALTGKVNYKNFSKVAEQNLTVTTKLINDDGEVVSTTDTIDNVDPEEEKEIAINLPISTKEEAVEKNAKIQVTITGDNQVTRTIEVPVSDEEVLEEQNKTVEITDNQYTFNPAFEVTWEENKIVEKAYSLPAITQDLTNQATLILGDNEKIEKSVLLSPKFKGIHEFISGTEGKALPDQVMDLLPTDIINMSNGDIVNPTIPTSATVTTEDGKWTFNGYDTMEKTINGGNVIFVGTWVFEKNVKQIQTNWVDENGKTLKDSVTAEKIKSAGEINGYTYVKTTIDDEGNATHHFKKNGVGASTKTGDSFHSFIYLGLLLLSSGMLVLMHRKRKQER